MTGNAKPRYGKNCGYPDMVQTGILLEGRHVNSRDLFELDQTWSSKQDPRGHTCCFTQNLYSRQMCVSLQQWHCCHLNEPSKLRRILNKEPSITGEKVQLFRNTLAPLGYPVHINVFSAGGPIQCLRQNLC
eukprot:jgi/Botrbrau1/22589/Bobra.176_1s0019.1